MVDGRENPPNNFRGDKMILADKLIQLRKKSGMSQEELAEKMNVSRQAVSKWEGAQSIPDLDKILQLSELYGVTTDYLLKDSVENEEYIGKDTAENVRKVTLEEANEYLALRKTASVRIALATFLCILSVIPLFILAGMTVLFDKPIYENMVGGLGMIIMLVIAAVAVGIYVYTGLQSAKYRFLEKEPFETEYGVDGVVKERQKEFHDTYVKCNVIGTCLCVLSPAALFAAAIKESEFFAVVMLSVMLIIAGIGVIFFIVAGVRKGSMDKLLKTGEFTENAYKKKHIKKIISPIYWSIVVAVYLLWLFIDQGRFVYNSLSWVIFPVAGALFPAVLGICSLIERKPQDKQ